MVPTEGGSSPPSVDISRNRTRACTPALPIGVCLARTVGSFFPRVLFVKSSRTAFEPRYRIEPARPLTAQSPPWRAKSALRILRIDLGTIYCPHSHHGHPHGTVGSRPFYPSCPSQPIF